MADRSLPEPVSFRFLSYTGIPHAPTYRALSVAGLLGGGVLRVEGEARHGQTREPWGAEYVGEMVVRCRELLAGTTLAPGLRVGGGSELSLTDAAGRNRTGEPENEEAWLRFVEELQRRRESPERALTWEQRLARLLELIAIQPNRREDPSAPGDAKRFDGGTVTHHTGSTVFALDDGTTVRRTMARFGEIDLVVEFPDGERVLVSRRLPVPEPRAVPEPVSQATPVHCIFCAARLASPETACPGCGSTHRLLETPTMGRRCSGCSHFNLLVARYCERCASPLT